MKTVNMLQAKSSLSRLVASIEQGEAAEIIIARNGHPVARLVPLVRQPVGQRIGVAKGLFKVPDSIDTQNDVIARHFTGEDPA